ncbi:carbohydrate ABC transporter permease [Vallitalea okinawensis]|uniref:carbohydrate ABC transporter permease n=1 Tax=Vallitalea okinawensis TaxID=2078660 RepID=UPI000CFC89DC|nr:carbohydrate ABC transporter permease [Vallitalea okinawensis]
MINNKRKSREDIVIDTFVYALLAIVTVVVAYPLIYVISASFSNPAEVINGNVILFPKDITIEGYIRVFKDDGILTGYRNTILYTVIGTFANIIITIITAYPLSRKDFVGRNVLMLIFTFTMFFSGGLIPTYLVIKTLGLIDNFWVMILPGLISVYNVIIARTFFQSSIPIELQEAAMIDGCSNFKILNLIVIPLAKPIIAVLVLYYGVAHWNAFFTALIYLSDKEKFPLQLILREILLQNQMTDMLDLSSSSVAEQQMWGEGIKYAIIIISSLPVIIIYPLIQRYFVKGVMIGALKG